MAAQRIEGIHAIEEALQAHVKLSRVYVATANNPRIDKLLARLTDKTSIQHTPPQQLDKMSQKGHHQGIIAELEPYHYAQLEDLFQPNKPNQLIILLDHITDEGNLGAIVRSAEVVGANGIIIPNARTATVGLGAYKTSAGAVFHLPIAQVPNLARAIKDAQDAGFWACAATEHADQTMWQAPLSGKVLLIMGAEETGVSELLLKKADFTAKIPQQGKIESLNVAQAATVLSYEWLRQSTNNVSK